MDVCNHRFRIPNSFPSVYEILMPIVEKAGLAIKRRELLGELSGKVIEIGAGTGFNLPYYPKDVQLLAVEPNQEMAEILRSKAAGTEINIEILDLPIDDLLDAGVGLHSFDFVITTLVLCSVPDVDRALEVISNLLAPGGQYLFIEHVVTPGPYEMIQKLATPVWRKVAGGCHLDRDILGSFDGSLMVPTKLFRFNFPLGRPLIPHGIMGSARLRSDFFG